MEIANWVQKILDTCTSDDMCLKTKSVLRGQGPHGTYLVSTDSYRCAYFKLNDNKQDEVQTYSLQTGELGSFISWEKVVFEAAEVVCNFTVDIQLLKDAMHALMCLTKNNKYSARFRIVDGEVKVLEINCYNPETFIRLPIQYKRFTPIVDMNNNEETVTLNVKQILELLPASPGKHTGGNPASIPTSCTFNLRGPTRPVSIDYDNCGLGTFIMPLATK